ncbi:hypothetical protein VOLCADRAFT_105440 [Volvox carteri f. nagariensis]|uniref:Uncharacterized protein n=1 Tax=Volvox carteri f. nagariensis TaxID=3068 RepID=D8U0U3_VOLCA|nr:uncharacterized protein VOLCADRAFT_105440 [Volvox carteri f. nagariensis]EFJ46700.1 hypothetical protein VOLCADRAFT_105440 [Volvox carteri f. nagariensis]|eukprot:XP_002952229.1 hypothetical protein VOLCADRAFT_105440 [Volvox carteri f. nagariensis]
MSLAQACRGCSKTTSRGTSSSIPIGHFTVDHLCPISNLVRGPVTAPNGCFNSAGAPSSRRSWRTNITCNNSASQNALTTVEISAREQEAARTLEPASADVNAPPPPATDSSALRANMQSRYEQAYSMSQLYAAERPPPIPPSEHERRRRVKDIQEVVDAGRRKGLQEDVIRSGLTQMDALLPGVLSLHRMKPSDWATVASDVNGVAEKVILLKSLYPTADIFKIVFKKPKLLLLTTKRLEQDAAQIMRLLSSAPNPCAILESTPDLVDPLSLSRCLANLAATFPGQDPVGLLQRHPDILTNLGSEAAVELTAEYGELSTKD